MNLSIKNRLLVIFSKNHFSKEDAKFVSDVLQEIDEKATKTLTKVKSHFLSHQDKVELIEKIDSVELRLTDKIYAVNRSIYIVGLVQFLAIVGSILAILNYTSN